MAKMIPSKYYNLTSSSAEKRIFELLKNDPSTTDWIVLHSLGLTHRGTKPYGEIDFVVLIPSTGVFCLEVKGGGVTCTEGLWETTNRLGQKEKLNRSPFLQAREGMFTLRETVIVRTPKEFPVDLIYGYAVVMPDVSFPLKSPEWESWQVIDRDVLMKPISAALSRLAREQSKFHPTPLKYEPCTATLHMLQQLLRPDFEIVISRGTQIEETEAQLLRLTQEQFDALDLLADNQRCLIEGPAGTGKTMLALEYARRSAMTGKSTLFICFNRLLGDWLERQVREYNDITLLTAGRFFKLIRDLIMRSSMCEEFIGQENLGQTNELYESVFPVFGQLAIEELKEFYDVLVMDEAQDLLRPGVLDVLNLWLKGGLASGCWAIFGDFQRQAIFSIFSEKELKALIDKFVPQYARARLTVNCRNTRNIGEETALLSGFDSPPYRLGDIAGLPVSYHYYDLANNQCKIIYDTISRMLDQGVKAEDIVVISHLRLTNSGIANVNGNDRFRINEVNEPMVAISGIPIIRFATVQAFKGMESPVIILCDVDCVKDGETRSILYIAMSRARSQLTVLLSEQVKPFIAECVRRKLLKGWNKNP